MLELKTILEAIRELTPDELEQLRQAVEAETEKLASKPKRMIGLHEHLGHAWMSDDFDDPLPDEFWLGQ